MSLVSSLFAKTAPGRLTLDLDLDRGGLGATPENPLEAIRAVNAPTVTTPTQTLRTPPSTSVRPHRRRGRDRDRGLL